MRFLERPFRPVDLTTTALQSFDLNSLIAQLESEPQYREKGRAGIALVRDAHVSVVLEALQKGSELRDHRAPASAMATLLSGRASFISEGGAKRVEMVPGTLVAFGADLTHALIAEENSACLIVIGGRLERG